MALSISHEIENVFLYSYSIFTWPSSMPHGHYDLSWAERKICAKITIKLVFCVISLGFLFPAKNAIWLQSLITCNL